MIANMLVAVVSGFAVTIFLVFAFFLLSDMLDGTTRNAWIRDLIRLVAGLAICGLIGAVIMQVFDLWIT